MLSGLLSLLLSSLTHSQHSGSEMVVSASENSEPGKESLYGELREGRPRGRGDALSGWLDFLPLSKDFQRACPELGPGPAPGDPDLALRKLSVRGMDLLVEEKNPQFKVFYLRGAVFQGILWVYIQTRTCLIVKA